MASELNRPVATCSETLLIRTQMSRGDIYTLEMRQEWRTFGDVQRLIDTVTGEGETVLSVWRIETHAVSGAPVAIEDITEEFDVRSAEQIEEDTKRAEREASRWAFTQRSHGTLNHAQQGI